MRKVGGSGTKGVGGGTGGRGMEAWRWRDEVGRVRRVLWMRFEEMEDGRSVVWVRMIIVELDGILRRRLRALLSRYAQSHDHL